MAHSNRLLIHWARVVLEGVLFVFAIIAAYLSKTEKWSLFFCVALVSTIIYLIVKVMNEIPASEELVLREDAASRMAIIAEQSGVDDYFNMQSARGQTRRNEITKQEISIAQSMCLCANSGASYLDPSVYRHWSVVEERLKRGVDFKVVLLDPCSSEKKFRNKINSNIDHVDSKINISSLINLMNTYGSLEIKFAQHGMNATVFATDKCLFFDPYHVGVVNGRIDNRSFSFKILPVDANEGCGYYLLFKAHFDTLWREGVSFSMWIEQNKDKLPGNLPVIKGR